jgi:hypothetical protein
MTKVCGDLVSGVSRSLTQDGKWHMELLDRSKKALFRISVVADMLE